MQMRSCVRNSYSLFAVEREVYGRADSDTNWGVSLQLSIINPQWWNYSTWHMPCMVSLELRLEFSISYYCPETQQVDEMEKPKNVGVNDERQT